MSLRGPAETFPLCTGSDQNTRIKVMGACLTPDFMKAFLILDVNVFKNGTSAEYYLTVPCSVSCGFPGP